jgi:hypothetical protein
MELQSITGQMILEAKSGNKDALEMILEKLNPLINKYCSSCNIISIRDQLKQELLEETIRLIYRFEPRFVDLSYN